MTKGVVAKVCELYMADTAVGAELTTSKPPNTPTVGTDVPRKAYSE